MPSKAAVAEQSEKVAIRVHERLRATGMVPNGKRWEAERIIEAVDVALRNGNLDKIVQAYATAAFHLTAPAKFDTSTAYSRNDSVGELGSHPWHPFLIEQHDDRVAAFREELVAARDRLANGRPIPPWQQVVDVSGTRLDLACYDALRGVRLVWEGWGPYADKHVVEDDDLPLNRRPVRVSLDNLAKSEKKDELVNSHISSAIGPILQRRSSKEGPLDFANVIPDALFDERHFVVTSAGEIDESYSEMAMGVHQGDVAVVEMARLFVKIGYWKHVIPGVTGLLRRESSFVDMIEEAERRFLNHTDLGKIRHHDKKSVWVPTKEQLEIARHHRFIDPRYAKEILRPGTGAYFRKSNGEPSCPGLEAASNIDFPEASRLRNLGSYFRKQQIEALLLELGMDIAEPDRSHSLLFRTVVPVLHKGELKEVELDPELVAAAVIDAMIDHLDRIPTHTTWQELRDYGERRAQEAPAPSFEQLPALTINDDDLDGALETVLPGVTGVVPPKPRIQRTRIRSAVEPSSPPSANNYISPVLVGLESVTKIQKHAVQMAEATVPALAQDPELAEKLFQEVIGRYAGGNRFDQDWRLRTAMKLGRHAPAAKDFAATNDLELDLDPSGAALELVTRLSIVDYAVQNTRQLFQEMWVRAFGLQHPTTRDADTASIDRYRAQEIADHFKSDLSASGELLTAVAANTFETWRGNLPQGSVVEREIDLESLGKTVRDRSLPIRMTQSGTLVINTAGTTFFQLPPELQRDSEHFAAAMLKTIWDAYVKGEDVTNPEFVEQKAREEHAEFRQRLAAEGRRPRRPETDCDWGDLHSADQDFNRTLVTSALQVVEDFLRQAAFRPLNQISLPSIAGSDTVLVEDGLQLS
jgi:hypothetical protein